MKKKILIIPMLIGLLLTLVIGVTAAYLAPVINGNEQVSTIVFNSGSVDLTYENGSSQINATSVLPGWTLKKEFSLTGRNNTGKDYSDLMSYGIKLVVEKNTFSDGAINYEIEGNNPSNNGTIAYVMPNTLKSGKSIVSLGYGTFDKDGDYINGVTHSYTLTISFPNKIYTSQNEDMGKQLSAYITIEKPTELVNLTIVDDKHNINKSFKYEKNKEYELPVQTSQNGSFFTGWSVKSGNGKIIDNKLTINDLTTINANYSSSSVYNYEFIKPTSENSNPHYTFITPVDGIYKIALWGASGGGSNGGLGGYTEGNIYLKKGTYLHVFVGEHPNGVYDSCYGYNTNNSFNGSKLGSCVGGGGATDVRLITGIEWDDFTSLKSRIIVSAGGGGMIYGGNGGSGGGLVGYDGMGYRSDITHYEGKGATQNAYNFGGSPSGTAHGGSGYYGSSYSSAANAGGGSSFISGHNGCDAIKEESTENNLIHTGQSIHYSGLQFTDTVMIDGNGYNWTDVKGELKQMPKPGGGYYETGKGHNGNGYARISLVSSDYIS